MQPIAVSPLRVAYAGDEGTPRSADFAAFLQKRFAEVRIVGVSDLGTLDLTGSDVLIVDGETELTQMWAPQLPARLSLQDFPIPTVLMGSLGGQVGDKLGLKIARGLGCVCLKESAVVGPTWGKHAIFAGPFTVPEVAPSLVPTPASFKKGPKGSEVGDEVAVVDVHSPVSQAAFEGSPELTAAEERGDEEAVRALLNAGSPIGLVSNPAGFLDSPDCEWLLGGISSKAIDYVAVGRHGRFLLWGFGAQPSEMTPFGAALFSNAVAYIAGFGSAPCEALRMSQPREWLRTTLVYMPPDGSLGSWGLSLPAPLGATAAEALERWSDYQGFLRFTGGASNRGDWVLDEELRALGVANDDPALPALLAEQLDAPGEAGERARTLWRRYLRRDVADVKGERAWLNAQSELFFSDWAGYRWISRTDLPHLNPPRLEMHAAGVVQVLADAHRAADGTLTARLRLTVNDGYYVYPPGSTEGLGLSVTTPAGSPFRIVGTPVLSPSDEHITQTEIVLVLEGPGDELALDVRSQACDAQQCLIPTTLEVSCAITSDGLDTACSASTVRFPAENPGWTYYVEGAGDDTPLPAEGEVTIPTGATIHLQVRGDLDALDAVPGELVSGLTAMDISADGLRNLRQFDRLSSLVLMGGFSDEDLVQVVEVLQEVAFLVIASDAVTGSCFAQLTPKPEAAVSVWGSGLTDEGMSALLQLRVHHLRTRVPRLSSDLLGSTSEIAAQDVMVGVREVAADALVELAARSPRLTSLNLVSEQEEAGSVLDSESVLRLRRRRPDLTINGTWLDVDAVERLASPEAPGLVIDPTAVATEPVLLTTENFDQLTTGDTPVLVDFMAAWCGPCKQLAPILHEITGELAGQLVVGTLDIDEQQAIAERYEISAIPALLLFRDGEPVARIGARDKTSMYGELAAVL